LPKLIKSSGDPRLDEAGLCIMKMLKFTPAMQGGRAVNSTVTWELPMRPAQ
jgi:outer membrane biosynthesis protein TonB